MQVATGALVPLLRKLGELLLDEYNLEKRVRKGVASLVTELEVMHAVLRKVGDAPPEQVDGQVRIWADKVRELSYGMEDAVDAFMVRVEGGHGPAPGPNNIKNRVKKFLKKTAKLFSKGRALHQISDAIKEAQELAKELGELRRRYMLEAHTGSAADAIDPLLKAVHKDVSELVGIGDTRDELIKKLLPDGDERSIQPLKTMSIVGVGGLGKTTLAKAVYEEIEGQFDCGAFVSVSRTPDMKRIFKKMLYELDKSKFANINEAVRDEDQLMSELKMFLRHKRYLIVIDDIWDEDAWGFIKCAFSNNNLGGRVMTTTRIGSVSKACCSSGDDIVYEMKPLTNDDSKRLFYKRIFPQGIECPPELEQVSREILKKCGGVPLAIITMASLLASNDQEIKPKYEWDNLLNSIGRGLAEGASAKDMQMILSFSYYDLPSHLKTCLLYLSVFPEDYEIRRDRLIWRWIAEGFVQVGKQETRLFELGESYFNELANRNLIQPVDFDYDGRARACRVHDMVLDLICSLSSGENFVTILDGTQGSMANSQSKVRRLSFQNSISELNTPHIDTTSMSQVRSVTLFRTDVDLIQSFSCFQLLRVLDLERCYLGKTSHKIDLRYVENLLHLRYLGLRGARIGGRLLEVGKLKFLETLDLRGSGKMVPPSIVHLRRLMCLYVDHSSFFSFEKDVDDSSDLVMPVGMGNLTSLEELTELYVDDSIAFFEELGQLMEMRVLHLVWHNNGDGDERNDKSVCTTLMVSLSNLRKMQSLSIENRRLKYFDDIWDSWVPPPHLRTFGFFSWTTTLPTWITSSLFPLLSSLSIQVDRVRTVVDIQILGKLSALRHLRLGSNTDLYTCQKLHCWR